MLQRRESFEQAEELAELSLEIAERSELPQAAARATNILALNRHLQQDLRGAELLYRAAMDRAFEVGDDQLVAWTTQNLGVIANVEGDVRRARTLYLESLGASVRAADEVSAMRTYNNLGMVCADLEEWQEAEVYFGRGIEIATQRGDTALLAVLQTNLAEPLIRTGEMERAWGVLDRAEAIASWTGDPQVLTTIDRFRGMVTRLQGNHHAADQHLEHALSLACEGGLELDRAEVLEEIARLRWDQGRRDEACAAARQALDGFLALGAARDVARVEAMLRDSGEVN